MLDENDLDAVSSEQQRMIEKEAHRYFTSFDQIT